MSEVPETPPPELKIVVTGNEEDLVYAPSKWESYLYDTRTARRSRLAKARGAFADALVSAYVSKVEAAKSPTETPDTAVAIEPVQVDALRAQVVSFARELFAHLYDGPKKLTTPRCRWAVKAFTAAAEVDEFESLRFAVETDADMTTIATRTILDRLATIADKLIDLDDVSDPDKADDEEEPPEGGGFPSPGITDNDEIRAALRGAVDAAQTECNAALAALSAFSPGSNHVPRQHEQPDTSRLDLAERLLANPNLLEIIKRAGRFERIARSVRKVRAERLYEEVVDVERGADVTRFLPASFATLMDPDLEALFWKDYVERGHLQYRLEGHEHQGRGPIVCLTDASGSMAGDNMVTAASIVIATMLTALREKRRVTALSFDTRILDVVRIDATDKRRITSGVLPKTNGHDYATEFKQPGEAILRVAGWTAEGGTDFTPPLRYALDYCGLVEDRADLVFITDGYAEVPASIMNRLRDARVKGLRVYGMLVGGGSVSDAMRGICDEVVNAGGPDAWRVIPVR